MKYIILLLALLFVSFSILHAQDTIQVRSGWNMIGAISTRALSQIRSVPPGIITSDYFGYSVGYSVIDTLKKGDGYWVKASQAGILLLDSSGTLCPATVEYAGKTYNTVQIGNQCWFKENLDVGTMITGSADQTNNSTIEKYCYENNPANCTTNGGLYQWNEAMQYSTTPGTQGICPTGWHIPTYAELLTIGISVNTDGNALKAIGQGTGNGAGTNTSDFSALLSGFRNYNGNFSGLGITTYFWSSTEVSATLAYYLNLGSYGSSIYFYGSNLVYGWSVRCLKD